jgi:hypothetical protein
MEFNKDIKIKPLPVKVAKCHRKVDLRLPLNPVVAFVGSTSSGKTTNMLNLLTKRNMLLNYFKVFIFSANFHRDSIWRNIKIPLKYVSTKYDEDRIEAILERQQHLKEKHKEKYGNTDTFKPALIIFDDMIGQLRSRYLSMLTTMNRHYSTHIWILSQSYKAISPVIRNQVCNWIIFPSGNEGETKKMSEELGGKKFLKMMDYVSKINFGFLHIDKKSPLKIRYRKGYDKFLTLRGKDIIEEKLIIKWNDDLLKTKKNRTVKLNKKPTKKKKEKKFTYSMCFEDYLSSDEESESSSCYSY